ncbi:hypothetical protein [Methylobacterium nigriterrae]|uniref:hypothetical protein n=1 Tax=Methylobacterium nigriterrae TaxID=3127512 RepID=UPI0030135802
MARSRTFAGAEQRAFLDKAENWRLECIRVVAQAPVGSLVYQAASGIIDAIDGLAEAVTGDRRHFHLKPPSTPDGNTTKPSE